MEAMLHKNDRDQKSKEAGGHFFKPVIQTKLSINEPGDHYEQEADHMADKVMRMPDNSINANAFFKPADNALQRKCQACEEEDKHVRRKETNPGKAEASSGLDNYVNSLGSSGQSMSASSRQFFEPRFGRDFSNVKIHTDSVAAKSAQSINALAYTTGNNIVFNSGQYSPDSDSGKKLMAHELTHVVQQNPASVMKKPGGAHPHHSHPQYCGVNSRKNPDYPNTYIDHVDVNLSAMNLTIHWSGPVTGISTNTATIATGAGLCCNDCNQPSESTTPEHACTPIVTDAPITSNRSCHLGGHPNAKFPSYFSRAGIAIHSSLGLTGDLGFARSHGCVRTEDHMAQLIQENSIANTTTVTVSGSIPDNKRDVCYEHVGDTHSTSRSTRCPASVPTVTPPQKTTESPKPNS